MVGLALHQALELLLRLAQLARLGQRMGGLDGDAVVVLAAAPAGLHQRGRPRRVAQHRQARHAAHQGGLTGVLAQQRRVVRLGAECLPLGVQLQRTTPARVGRPPAAARSQPWAATACRSMRGTAASQRARVARSGGAPSTRSTLAPCSTMRPRLHHRHLVGDVLHHARCCA